MSPDNRVAIWGLEGATLPWEKQTPNKALRLMNQKARRHFLKGLLALLPFEEGWTKEEREEWLAVCGTLVDWLVTTVEGDQSFSPRG